MTIMSKSSRSLQAARARGRDPRSAMSLLALEQRMVFDAAAAATTTKAMAADATPGEPADPVVQDAALHEVMAALGTSSDAAQAQARTIVFIDGAVRDPSVLAQAAASNGKVVFLDPNRDGVTQIAEALAGRHDLDAIHIVSHGDSGALQLGTSVLTADSINGSYAGEMALIRSALSESGDILVYGCDVAAGAQGEAFVSALADATGADVAASTDTTGAAALGGDWTLERETGNIEAAVIDGRNWNGALVEQIINPTGGVNTTGADGLRIYVTNDGQLQVLYQNKGQVYSPFTFDASSSLYNGMYMAVGTQLVGPDQGAESMVKVPWTQHSPQTLTGAGTEANPYVITTRMYYDADTNGTYSSTTDVLMEVKTTYIFPQKHFTETVTITPPANNTKIIKFYHAIDTYLDGGDNGPAFSLNPELAISNNTTGNPSFVGVRKAVGTPQESIVGFAEIQGDREFDRYYSAVYYGDPMYASGMAGGGDIKNTWDTNPGTDNAIAVQFTLGAIVGPRTFSYNIAFGGDTNLDLDANNSTTGGNGFVNTFQAGTGTIIKVVDSDVKITNVIGDIPDITITLTNPQAGDVLFVDPTALPPGISVEGYSPTSITLSGVADEAAYEAALKQIQFTSTGGSTGVRTVTFSMHNQLNSAATVATATLNGDFSPLVDLNSGLGPITSTNNIVVNSGFSDYADAPYGWTEGGTGTTTDSAITGRYAFTATAADTLTKTGLTGINVGPSVSGAGRLFVDIGYVNGDTATRTMDISVGGVTYARLTTGGAAGTPGTISYLNGARNGAGTTADSSVPVMTSATGSMTVVQIDLPSTVAASGNLVFSTSAAADDIYIDNVKLQTNTTTFADATPGVDFSGTYTENGTPVAVGDVDMDVRDGDNANMASAVITITNPVAGDRLLVGGSSAASGTIGSISWSRTDNVVTLTGSDSKAAYAAAIRSIAFESTSDDPGNTVRDITVSVSDGGLSSTPAHTYMSVVPVNDAPSTDLDGSAAGTTWSATFKENGTAVAIADTDALVADPDNANMQSATITLTNPQSGDRLLVNGSLAASGTLASGIAWSRTGSQVVLSGDFTKADYAAALSQIQFDNTLDNPTTTPRAVTVTVSDGNLSSVASTATIGIDLAPDPSDDAVTGNEDTAISGNVLTNDVDAGTTPITSVTIASAPAHGTLTSFDTATGAFVYTPAQDFNGTDSFTYLLTDANGDAKTATVVLTVNPVNDAPIDTVPATFSVLEDTLTPIPGVSVADVDGDTLTTRVSIASGTLSVATGGGATVSGNGSGAVTLVGSASQINASLAGLTYLGAPDHTGSISLDVSTTDGTATDLKTIALTITPVADIVADGATTSEDQSVTIDVLANDTFEAPPIIVAIDGQAISTGVSVAVAHGTVTLNANGTLTFAPTHDDNRATAFNYTVTSGGSLETAAVSLTIDPVNDAPTDTVPGARTVAEDTTTAITGVMVADVDGDTLTTTLSATNGTLTVTIGTGAALAGNGSALVTLTGTAAQINAAIAGLTFRGAPDYVGPAMLTVHTSDGTLSATDTVSLTVTPVADVIADSASVSEDGSVVIDALGNDGFAGAPAITAVDGVAIAPGGSVLVSSGRVTLNVDGTLTFAPRPDFNGPASFSYTVGSGAGAETGTVNVSVAPAYDPPVHALPGSQAVREDVSTSIGGVSITDVDGATLTTTLTASSGTLSVATGGGAAIGGNGGGVVMLTGTAAQINTALAGLAYRSAPDIFGAASLTVATSDGTTTVTDVVGITVTPVADAVADTIVTIQDRQVTFDLLANDTFSGPAALVAINGTPVAAGSVVNIAHGQLLVNGDGTITLTPEALYMGPDSFTYTVHCNGGDETAAVSVTVDPPNARPTVVADFGASGQNTSTSGNVLTNDSDADGDPLSVSAINGVAGNIGVPVIGSSGGTFTVAADGAFTFAPGTDFVSLAQGATATTYVDYTAFDGLGTTVGRVTVTVTGINDAPIATSLSDAALADGTSVSLDVSGAFSDPDSNPLTFAAAGLPAGLHIDPSSGLITGTLGASASQSSPYTATITASDGQGGSVSRDIVVRVTNPAPTAVADSGAAIQDAGTVGNVLVNDVDPDGDPLRVSAVSGLASSVGVIVHSSTGGTFIIGAAGGFTFDPGSDFIGLQAGQSRTTAIDYTIDDGNGGTSTATLVVVVDGRNDSPAIGTIGTLDHTDGQAVVDNLAAYFTDADSDALTYSATGLPPGMTLDPGTGVISGTLAADASLAGPYSVVVTADDHHGGTVSQTFSFAVRNLSPTATPDTFTITETTTLTGTVIDAGDRDAAPDADAVAIVSGRDSQGGAIVVGGIATLPSGAQLTLNADGTFTYVPGGAFTHLAAGEQGTETFSYTLSDGQGGTATATVTIAVQGLNDGPVLVDPLDPSNPSPSPDTVIPAQISGTGEVAQVVDASRVFHDPDASDHLTFTATGLPSGLTIDPATGRITGTVDRASDTTSPYLVTVTADDGHGGTASAQFEWAVVNHPPVAADGTATVVENTPLEGSVAGDVTDPGGDTLTFGIVTGPAHGTLTLDPTTGAYVYTPAVGYNGADSFTYQADDGFGGVATATVTLSIVPEPPVPIIVPALTPSADQQLLQSIVEQVRLDRERAAVETSGIVLDTVDKIRLSHRSVTLQGDRGMLMSTVNRVQSLGGHANIGVDGYSVLRQVEGMSETRGYADNIGGRSTPGFAAWAPEGQTGFSLSMSVDGGDRHGASDRAGAIVIDTVVRDRVLYLEMKSTVDKRLHGRVVDYKVTQADGSPLPPGMSRMSRDLLMADTTLGARDLNLKIIAVFEDGTEVERQVRVRLSNGEMREATETTGPRADATFQQQLAAAAGTVDAELSELLRALRG